MTQIEAIYHDGIFQPLQPVDLKENQRVRLNIKPLLGSDAQKWEEWLATVEEHKRRIIERRGILPDSTPDIAEDRRR